MSEQLFDLADEYEAMLMKGVSLSGEHWTYFAQQRVRDLQRHLPPGFKPRRILDFGCGIGYSSQLLAEAFPGAEVLGADTSCDALRRAEAAHGSSTIQFATVDALPSAGAFDLCYTNGVFHHIEPAQRRAALAIVAAALTEGGYFALFENNPWNPGTRMVMRRIPFDRDASTLSPSYAKLMLRAQGWNVVGVRSLFYFPRLVAGLRVLEPWLANWPLGAQYYVLGQRPQALDTSFSTARTAGSAP